MGRVESLQELCVDVIADNLDAICCKQGAEDHADSEDGDVNMWTSLKPGIQLPSAIAEQICDAVNTRIKKDFNFYEAAMSEIHVNLTSINCDESDDIDLLIDLLPHKPFHLNMRGYWENDHSRTFWEKIPVCSENLRTLHVPFFACSKMDSDDWESCEKSCFPLIPKISKLHTFGFTSGRNQALGHAEFKFLPTFIQRCPALTCLDLSLSDLRDRNDSESSLKFVKVIPSLVQLKTLILFDCQGDYSEIIPALKQLYNLEVLDLSVAVHSKTYPGVEKDMEELIKALPKLVHLDISGTQRFVPVDNGEPEDSVQYRPIPWLGDRRLKFLGLLGCFRPRILSMLKNLPAAVISGHFDWKQTMVSLGMYRLRRSNHIILPLVVVFKVVAQTNLHASLVIPTVKAVLNVMETHPDWSQAQVYGISIMYHILRRFRHGLTCPLRRRILRAVLKGQTLTKLPEINRMVPTVLHLFKFSDLEVYFDDVIYSCLNCLEDDKINNFAVVVATCFLQKLLDNANNKQKLRIVEFCAVETICALLETNKDKYDGNGIRKLWKALLSITDDCPQASRRFVDYEHGLGLKLIKSTLEGKQDTEIEETLLGIVANLADCEECHDRLETHDIKYTILNILRNSAVKPSVFGDSSVHVGSRRNIRKYNDETQHSACFVLLRLVSSNPKFLLLTPPQPVIACVMSTWDIKKKREKRYRNVSSLVKLLISRCNVTLYYALWELTSMINTDAKTYIPMLKRDGLIEVSMKMIRNSAQDSTIERMIQDIMSFVIYYEENSKLSTSGQHEIKIANGNNVDRNNGNKSDIDNEFADPVVFKLVNSHV